jgi:hypothetical protein
MSIQTNEHKRKRLSKDVKSELKCSANKMQTILKFSTDKNLSTKLTIKKKEISQW